MKTPEPPQGPVEQGAWAEQLTARAVTLGPSPRLWGYDVQGDLTRHYGPVEMAWLAILGSLPDCDLHAKVLEVVLGFLAPVTMAEAPSHAAGLTRLCGSEPASVISVAALTLSQQGRHTLNQHAELWAWLRGEGAWPEALSVGREHAGPSQALAERLGTLGYDSPVFERSTHLVTTCLSVLFELGMSKPEQLLSLWVWCKMPYVLAEAFAVSPGRLLEYPMNVPKYVYEGDDE